MDKLLNGTKTKNDLTAIHRLSSVLICCNSDNPRSIYIFQKSLIFILITTSILISSSCKKKEMNTQQNTLQSLIFNVDESLIGEKRQHEKLNISYRIPKNWKNISYSEIEGKLDAILKSANPNEKRNIILLDAFNDNDKSSYLIISEIENIDFGTENFKYKFENSLKHSITEDITIKSTEFLFLPFHIYQFQILRDQMVFVKMVLGKYKSTSEVYQIDFLTTVEKYPSMARVLESFVGSLQLINHNQ